MNVDAQKRAAAARAVEFVRPGMRLGLGTGSTARHFVELLAERVRAGLDIVAVPTSEATRAHAERLGIAADDARRDARARPDRRRRRRNRAGSEPDQGRRRRAAAREDRRLRLRAHDRHRRRVEMGRRCSAAFRLPIEIVPFGAAATRRAVERPLAAAGCPGPATLRTGNDGHAFVTDGGHWLLDAALGAHRRPARACGSGCRRSRASWSTACSSGLRRRLFSRARTGCASSSGPDRQHEEEWVHVRHHRRAQPVCSR